MTLLINDQRLEAQSARPLQPTTSWSWVFTLLVFTPLCFLAMANADYFALGEEAIAVFWPANGLLLGALLLNRLRRWPVLILIAFACELGYAFAFNRSAGAMSVVLHLANPLEVLLGGWLIILFMRYASPASYARKTLIFTLLASVIAAGIGSFLGASAFVRAFPGAPFAYTWQAWWLSDALGFIIVTPAVFGCGERMRGNRPQPAVTLPRAIETILMTLGLLGSVFFVFGENHTAPFSIFDFPYVTVPFALWAAFRLTGDGAALMYLILASLAVWLTAEGTGPYQVLSFDLHLQALALQTYLFSSFLMILLINAVVRDREEAPSALRASGTTQAPACPSPCTALAGSARSVTAAPARLRRAYAIPRAPRLAWPVLRPPFGRARARPAATGSVMSTGSMRQRASHPPALRAVATIPARRRSVL